MEDYDEDLSLNPFLIELQTEYNHELFSRVVQENFLLCVPQVKTVTARHGTKEYYENHILRSLSSSPNGLKNLESLTHKLIVINDSILTVHEPDGSTWENRILFEETFYPSDALKYRVLCVDQPLVRVVRNVCGSSNNEVLPLPHDSLSSCTSLLTTADITNLDNAIESRLPYFTTSFGSISQLKSSVGEILRSSVSKCHNCHSQEKSIVAVESYVLHKVSKPLLRLLSSNHTTEDVHLNKLCKNLVLIQPVDLNIEPRFQPFLPQARQEFAKFGDLTTPLSKLYCLKRTLAWFSNLALTADDVLSILIFLIIKSPVANWNAQKSYLQHFRFSPLLNTVSEFGYYIASLEAALQHIRSNELHLPELVAPTPLFDHVRRNDADALALVLQKCKLEIPGKCHPLCQCNSCASSGWDINNEVDASGKSLLHHACYYGHPQVVDLLTKNGLHLDLKDFHHYVPLHYAALRGHQHAVLLLCHAGADIRIGDKEHNTPLHLAALGGQDACVKALLYFAEHVGQEIDVNAKNTVGDTALHLAAKYGYTTIIETLLEHGAVLEQNLSKSTPVDIAQNLQVAEYLLTQYTCSKGTAQKPKGRQAYREFLSKFVVGWKSKKKEEEESDQKVTKLMLTIERGDVQLACFYLGLDGRSTRPVEVDVQDAQGNTPLLQACMHGQKELAIMLVKRGAAVNVRNRMGQSALFHAVKLGQIELVETLLEGGALTNVPDCRGQTPLHLAAQMGNLELAKKLCEKKANVFKKDWRHQKPLDIAQRRGHAEVIKFLIEREILASTVALGMQPTQRLV